MAVQIQLRNDTAENWTEVNPTLARGEIGVEIDTNKMKIGTGITAWDDLPYMGIDAQELIPLLSYTHNQTSANTVWTINHGLGYRPSVTIFDNTATEVEGAITHVDNNNVSLEFSIAITGTAYLS
jgi:hypothetical protein